jgi:PAS domain S-box-containing protein
MAKASGARSRRYASIASLDMDALRPTFLRIARLAAGFVSEGDADIVFAGAKAKGWRARDDLGWSKNSTFERSFCAVALDQREPLWIEDARQDSRFKHHGRVTGPTQLRFYAAAQIRLPGGAPVGVVCVSSSTPRPYDAQLVERLQDLAGIAADECHRQLTVQKLAKAEAKARAAQHFSDELIDNAPVAVCMTDRRLRILRVNSVWKNERFQTDDCIGRYLYHAVPSVGEIGEVFARCLRGETMRSERHQVTLEDGSTRWVRIEVTPWRDSRGRIGGVLNMSIDITNLVEAMEETERASERLKIATKLAEFRVWEMDYRRGELAADNNGGRRMDGAEEPSVGYEDLRRDMFTAIHPLDRERVREEWRQAMAEGRTFRSEYRYPSDLKEIWLEAASEQIRGENGRVERVIGIYKDITARRAAAMELVQAKEAAESANRAKSDFLATMSHEIRTPLNGVLGMAQAMAREELSETQRERLGVIRTSGEQLLSILNDILDLAKIEAGKLELEEVDFDLEAVARGVHSAFSALAAKKGLAFRLDLDGVEGVYRGDPTRLRQVLYNLVSNALKFTEAGESATRLGAGAQPGA